MSYIIAVADTTPYKKSNVIQLIIPTSSSTGNTKRIVVLPGVSIKKKKIYTFEMAAEWKVYDSGGKGLGV